MVADKKRSKAVLIGTSNVSFTRRRIQGLIATKRHLFGADSQTLQRG